MTEEHTLVALVEDKPGVLNRVASLFRRRNFNIDSLTVGRTNIPGVSRMTIVVGAGQTASYLVEMNLNKLVNVISVRNVTQDRTVTRDLALIKVKADAPARAEISQIAEIFRAKIVDVSQSSLIVEVTGTEDKIDSMLELLEPFGIIEMVRTGRVAMVRGEQSVPPMNGRRPALKSVS
ncbi:MAG: acetolactate synthase small subunit [Chloroflexi bacterium]|nr:MAG: acetolactate synthase small subunit [Chloroflexota bacterium]